MDLPIAGSVGSVDVVLGSCGSDRSSRSSSGVRLGPCDGAGIELPAPPVVFEFDLSRTRPLRKNRKFGNLLLDLTCWFYHRQDFHQRETPSGGLDWQVVSELYCLLAC